ncbi:hypothetical protein [Arthrobacter sp. SLBN-122]|uniref:hypothetical protein n=1 Tax=Arthrobacter sp. SLBN-122 TaxID=2768455 RepID=UPI001150265F|nr:hypothetical protein [Arthrobacter sp. SLBN-122]
MPEETRGGGIPSQAAHEATRPRGLPQHPVAVIAVGQIDESINPELMREARAVFDSIMFMSDKTS